MNKSDKRKFLYDEIRRVEGELAYLQPQSQKAQRLNVYLQRLKNDEASLPENYVPYKWDKINVGWRNSFQRCVFLTVAIIVMLCAFALSALLIYFICIGHCRWGCALFLLIWSGLLILASDSSNAKEWRIPMAIASYIEKTCITLAIVGIVTVCLIPIGYVWYYFCCGFLLFPNEIFGDSPSLGESVAYFILSMLLLTWIGGLIAIAFGWNPFK